MEVTLNRVKKCPSKARLRELFWYRDGWLYRKSSAGGERINSRIGCNDGHGYIRARVDGIDYQLHRLIWAYHFGPTQLFLDHKNRNKRDNKIENLRLASKANNEWNTPKRRHNTTGYKGVYRLSEGHPRSFWAYITINGKRHGLGCYETAKEASSAYKKAAKKLHGRFYVGNS